MWNVAILAAAVGGFFGVAGGVLGPLVREWYISRRERESLKAALIEEVASVLEIADRRGRRSKRCSDLGSPSRRRRWPRPDPEPSGAAAGRRCA